MPYSLRYFLWWLNWYRGRDCPACDRPLMQHGWEPNERYTCPDDSCRFNARWKARQDARSHRAAGGQ